MSKSTEYTLRVNFLGDNDTSDDKDVPVEAPQL